MLKIPRGTDVETSPTFDHRWFHAQTALQALLAALVVLGLTGLFGGGFLSTAHIKIGSAEVTYDRFSRRSVPIRIAIGQLALPSGEPLRVALSRELTDKTTIVRTVPPAASSRETADGVEFAFTIDHPQAPIVISVQPDRFGAFSWTLRIDGVGEASLFQIIYP